ncbi:MAG: hypothetical protein V4463_25245 [Pseudomonadota bacterium]
MSQWRGSYSGAGSGTVTLELDEQSAQWLGQATLRSADPKVPSLLAGIAAPAEGELAFRTPWIAPLHPETGLPEPWEKLHGLFEAGVRIPLYADITGQRSRTRLRLALTTNLGTHIDCDLVRTDAPPGLLARWRAVLGRWRRWRVGARAHPT